MVLDARPLTLHAVAGQRLHEEMDRLQHAGYTIWQVMHIHDEVVFEIECSGQRWPLDSSTEWSPIPPDLGLT